MTDNSGNISWSPPADDRVRELLKKARTIAVVGLSSNPDRPSHGVAAFLQSKGYRVIPINPKEDAILEEKSYPDLESLNEQVDIVEVFRRSEHTPEIVKSAVNSGAPVVWLQEGVHSEEAAEIGLKNGLMVIMDRCMAKEYRRLID